MRLGIKAAAVTHPGKVRANNEDNFYLQGHIRENVEQKEAAFACFARDSRFLAAVADGMGGQAFGEKASLTAVQALHPCRMEQAKREALDAVARANGKICREIAQNGGRRMGSTLAALYIDGGRALCCNIGDSRCYFLRGGELFQISTDHNKAGSLVELGILTPEQAARHSSRHELTRHLGIFPEEMVLEPSFSETLELRPGDAFLLCSDGLTDMVSDADIANFLTGEGTPEQQAEALVDLALQNGGRDNVTALAIRVEKTPGLGFCRLWNGKGKQG